MLAVFARHVHASLVLFDIHLAPRALFGIDFYPCLIHFAYIIYSEKFLPLLQALARNGLVRILFAQVAKKMLAFAFDI